MLLCHTTASVTPTCDACDAHMPDTSRTLLICVNLVYVAGKSVCGSVQGRQVIGPWEPTSQPIVARDPLTIKDVVFATNLSNCSTPITNPLQIPYCAVFCFQKDGHAGRAQVAGAPVICDTQPGFQSRRDRAINKRFLSRPENPRAQLSVRLLSNTCSSLVRTCSSFVIQLPERLLPAHHS